ncbi:MAG: hypothetical protein LWY06_19510 [Firmicutes bacterium]|nr:hypothetical protein [Bacillota bacterium]
MKKILVMVFIATAFFCFVMAAAIAGGPVIKPCQVAVYVEKMENKVGTFQGIKVKVRETDDEFFGYNSFISLDDLTALGKKFNKSVKYDPKAKMLVVGSKSLEVVPVKVTKDMEILLNKIRKVEYKGKPYFDLWNVSGGLGFEGVSKMNDGVLFSAPSKK